MTTMMKRVEELHRTPAERGHLAATLVWKELNPGGHVIVPIGKGEARAEDCARADDLCLAHEYYRCLVCEATFSQCSLETGKVRFPDLDCRPANRQELLLLFEEEARQTPTGSWRNKHFRIV